MTDVIICPQCRNNSLVRDGAPILPPPQVFQQDTFGPTRLTPVGMETRYPVHCETPGCPWHGSLTGPETERLLMQIVLRTGDVNV